MLAAGVNPALIDHPNYVPAKGVLEQVDLFDADFFGMSELDATLLDPQHRMFLLSAWEALEYAGYAPKQVNARVGVFASTGISLYLLHNILKNPDCLSSLDEYQVLLANDKDFLATRISYLLNLKGPSITLQTGCSSSLVCVHYAVQSLLNGECDMALAGGVSITLPQEQGYLYRKEMIGSADGHCYAFDKRAQGTVKSNGAGIVLLKPLSDAIRDQDTIVAVIRGSAINNDGAQKVGFTAPNSLQQTAVIQEALAMADAEPDSIGYVETHGTGTLLGDPIELAALKQAFFPYKKEKSCALVSLKTNLGHLDVAAGVASLIRACLAVNHGKIPPSLHFSELNEKISLADSPFFVNTELRDWPKNQSPRRAGISAFGVGGTNVHVIVQEPPAKPVSTPSCGPALCLVSARSAAALKRNVANLLDHCREFPDISLPDLAYTLQVGRELFPYRASIAAENISQLIENASSINFDTIKPVTTEPSLIFMFSGQGAQYPGMGEGLYHDDTEFKKALDEVIAAFSPYLACDLRQHIHPLKKTTEAGTQLMQTAVAQPALFAIEYALAKSYMAKGAHPTALIGHSIGEYVAAVLAGVFTLEDAARLIAKRGQLVQQLPPGKMIAVPASSEAIHSWLPDSIDIALENSPNNTVLAGSPENMQQLENLLKARQINHHSLHTSHAFHSRMLDPILEEFRQYVALIKRQAPRMPMISNVTGTWLTEKEACSVEYWVQQLRQTVKFSQGIALLQKLYSPVFLEIGPGKTLQTLVFQQGIQNTMNSLRHPLDSVGDLTQLQNTLGFLWQKGVMINLFNDDRRIPLPVYSWDLKRYWIDAVSQENQPTSAHEITVSTTIDVKHLLKMAWKKVLGVEPKTGNEHFFNQGGHSLSAIHFIDLLPETIRAHTQVIHLYQYPTFSQFLRFVESHPGHIDAGCDVSAETELFLEGGEL